jgi:hypothetical protein
MLEPNYVLNSFAVQLAFETKVKYVPKLVIKWMRQTQGRHSLAGAGICKLSFIFK